MRPVTTEREHDKDKTEAIRHASAPGVPEPKAGSERPSPPVGEARGPGGYSPQGQVDQVKGAKPGERPDEPKVQCLSCGAVLKAEGEKGGVPKKAGETLPVPEHQTATGQRCSGSGSMGGVIDGAPADPEAEAKDDKRHESPERGRR